MVDMNRIKKILSLIVAILLLQVILSIMILYNITTPSSASSVNDYMKNSDTAKIVSEIMSQSTHILGNKDASVTMIMFADFQCPYCNATFPVINRVMNNYKDKVKFSFHHFPLPEHKEAWQAALALEAAGNQNKYWEMYELLIDKYQIQGNKALTNEAIIDNAEKLSLNIEEFKSDIDHQANMKIIQKDLESGQKIGVKGIPTVYINDRQVNGNQDYQIYSQIIEEEIARSNNSYDKL